MEVFFLKRKLQVIALLLALCLLLAGCGASVPVIEDLDDQAVPLSQSPVSRSGGLGAYVAPPFASSQYHADKAQGSSGAFIDTFAVSEGYVAVSATSDHRLKFQVKRDDCTYNYDISSDGKPAIFPLQSGNGSYTFRVMENVSDNKYAQVYSTSCNVTMVDQFQPFLRPSNYSNYSEASECVRKASQLVSGCSTELDVVSAIYDYVCGAIKYDTVKATSVSSGYLPDPDETLRTGKGICFDYAALAAAMLRSQGIPTKIIFGYVAPDNLYHAWNMFYTEESGWVTVSFEVSADTWARIDLTFSAGGASDQFIGDGSHYTDVYSY